MKTPSFSSSRSSPRSSTVPYWSPRTGRQHLAGQLRLDRRPIDVERVSVARARRRSRARPATSALRFPAIPMWFGTRSIRRPRPSRRRASENRTKAASPPSSLTDAIVIGDVIAVRALRARFEEGRGVAVRRSRVPRGRDEAGRIVEGEPGPELQTIGGERNPGTGRRRHRVSSAAEGEAEGIDVGAAACRAPPGGRARARRTGSACARARSRSAEPPGPDDEGRPAWPPAPPSTRSVSASTARPTARSDDRAGRGRVQLEAQRARLLGHLEELARGARPHRRHASARPPAPLRGHAWR